MEDSNNPGITNGRSGTVPEVASSTPGERTASGPGGVLESGVPLSHSVIWERQREYYVRRGLETWTTDKLPEFITNNPQIAEIYAEIAFGFLRDCMGHGRSQRNPIGPETPLRIVELGAAAGKFAFLFLRQMGRLLEREHLPGKIVRYTMTDCSDLVVRSWHDNRYLAEFAEAGILEFERFDAGEDAGRLVSGKDSRRGPVVVIANYVFDSLPQDAFSIAGGRIEEFLVTTGVKDEQKSVSSDALSSSKPQISFQTAPVSRNRYSEPAWNSILEDYAKRLEKATVLFPAAALAVINNLAGLSDGRMLVLAADKGDVHEDTLALGLVKGPPAFEWHSADCFSLMVNFDAIGKAFLAQGGEALLPDKHASKLHVVAFLKGGSGERFSETELTYRRTQAAAGPDDVFALLAWLNSHMEEIGIPQILATLRLTRWDPIALMRLFPVLGRQLRTVGPEREDLRGAVMRTWANHYPIASSDNVLAFQCGVILLELKFFEDAMEMFKRSQEVLGPSAPTSYNLGLCALGMDRREDALEFMKQACALDPGFEAGRRSREKLEREREVSS